MGSLGLVGCWVHASRMCERWSKRLFRSVSATPDRLNGGIDKSMEVIRLHVRDILVLQKGEGGENALCAEVHTICGL